MNQSQQVLPWLSAGISVELYPFEAGKTTLPCGSTMRSCSPAPLAAAPAQGVTACAKADTADAAGIRGEELHSLHSFPRSCCPPRVGPRGTLHSLVP